MLEIPRWEAYLKTIGFTPAQAQRAELWITRGDWSFKGKLAKLEGSDFFPTDAKLKDLLVANTVLMSRTELHALMNQYKQEGAVEERERSRTMYSEEERFKITEEMQAVVQENMKLRQEIVELTRKVTGIENDYDKTTFQALQQKIVRTETALQGTLNDVMQLQDAIKQILTDENMYNHYRQQLRTRELTGVPA